jgi:DMSO/TMAO reductase YedYZ molybdopterin-dependent catalytic subunit
MKSVWDVLKSAKGIKNAVSIAVISKKTGLTRRCVERRISCLRDMGKPVLSNCSSNAGPLGIYLAQTDKQVEMWERQMYRRIGRVSRHRRKVSKKFYSRHQQSLILDR